MIGRLGLLMVALLFSLLFLTSPMAYIFQSERLGFRQWLPSDLVSFASMMADERVMEYYPAKKTSEETAAYIDKQATYLEQHGFGLYAVDLLDQQQFIGYIGLKRFEFAVPFAPGIEIGWRLSPEVWGLGLATEGALACLNHGWTALGFEKIYSFTALPNKRSERVMQKIGMLKTGEFDHPMLEKGHWLNRHVLYEIERPA